MDAAAKPQSRVSKRSTACGNASAEGRCPAAVHSLAFDLQQIFRDI
jgi:hypothetical protein